jgi:hypothetical protein
VRNVRGNKIKDRRRTTKKRKGEVVDRYSRRGRDGSGSEDRWKDMRGVGEDSSEE